MNSPKTPEAPGKSQGDRASDAPSTMEERIDEGLEESFPASDPPAVHEERRRS